MPADAITALFSQGVAVGALLWFMLRLEALLKELTKQTALNTRATMLSVIDDPARAAGEKAQAQGILKETGGK